MIIYHIDDDLIIYMRYWPGDVLVNVLFMIQLYSEKYIYIEGGWIMFNTKIESDGNPT